jgi:hypothetical protein
MSPTYNIYTNPRRPSERHFSEIVADTVNWDIICLSNVGFSNFGIVDQIKTAISIKPDLIIFNTTSYDRNEFVVDHNKNHDYGHTTYPILRYLHYDYIYIRNLLKQHNLTPYLISVGISPPVISDYYINLAYNLDKSLGKKVEESRRHIEDNIKGLMNLYDSSICNVYDSALVNTTILEVVKNKIPFICMMDYLNLIQKDHYFDTNNYILPFSATIMDVIKENNKAGQTFQTLLPFHTLPERQKNFAEIILDSMSKQNLV